MANLTKDQRILRDNPNKTPHELLLLGLSAKAYEELVAKQEKDLKAPVHPEPQPAPQVQRPVVKTVPKINAIAKTNVPAPMFNSKNDMAWLVPKAGKAGKALYMTKAQALRQQRKYPQDYDVK